MLFRNAVLALALASAALPAAFAETTSAVKLTSGEIRKVDAEQGKLTIEHEAIENLEMPAMTMVFKTDKPELLTGVKVGDKVQFRAEKVAGALTVVQIQAVK